MSKYEIVVGYEDVAPDVVRVPGSLPRAGIFLLRGGCHVAAHGSRAERGLLEAGALLVAHLRFDADPREGRYTGGGVQPVLPRRAALQAAAAASGN
jgi:hypothetical protein